MLTLAAVVGGAALAALKSAYDTDQVDAAYRKLIAIYARQGQMEVVKWIRAHEHEVRSSLWKQLKPVPKGKSLWKRFHERSLPAPGEKGYRPPLEWAPDRPDLALQARLMLDLARQLYAEPEIYDLWLRTRQVTLEVDEGDLVLEEANPEDADELADFIGVPAWETVNGQERRIDPIRRGRMALWVFRLAGQTRWDGGLEAPSAFDDPDPYGPSYPDPEEAGRPMPVWVAEAILADSLRDRDTARLRLVAVPRSHADAWIRSTHSVLGHPTTKQGGVPARTMYLLGAALGDRLVAVGTAGHPSGPWKRVPQKNVLELTRIASDGTVPNASSLLASRMLDLAPSSRRDDPSEPWHFATYSLLSESGATYEALQDKGLRPVEVFKGRGAGRGGQRSREIQSAVEHGKIVWEAGPAARPARWWLLEAARNKAPEKTLVKASDLVNKSKKGTPASRRQEALELLAPWLSQPVDRYGSDLWDGLGIFPRDDQTVVLDAQVLRERFGPDLLGAGLAQGIVELADELHTDPQWLAELMAFETGGTFSPSVQHPVTKATGLIQFMPSTAKALGTTVENLAAMNTLEQLGFVERYFRQFNPPFDSRQRLFMAVFYPAARFWPAGREFPAEVQAVNKAATPAAYADNVARFAQYLARQAAV